MTTTATIDQQADIAMVIASPLVHFTTMAKIENKDGQLVKVEKVTPFEFRIYQAYEWLMATNQPVRIIAAPKPRQSGGSTACGHICYHHTRRFKVHGMMMADEYDRTKKIWALFQRFADNDGFAEYWDSKTEINTEEARFHYRDADGTKRVAIWEGETANDAKAGASGTRRVLWFSEAMRYKREGDASDARVIGNALNSLPHTPGTVVFLESTAEGPGGYAYDIWRGAVTLEDRIVGNLGNGWVKVFTAWHECSDYRLERGQLGNTRWFDDSDPEFASLRDAEEAGRMVHHWTPEQVAWRRMKIIGEQQGALFDRDYPDTEETAFRVTSEQRFDVLGLAHLVAQCDTGYSTALIGDLEQQPNSRALSWHLNPHGFIWMAEEPIPGCEYVAFCDVATGAQSEGAKVRDCAAAGILRKRYTCERKIEHETEVVAVLHAEGGVRWDNDIVCERFSRLIRHYGDCITIVEANNYGGEVIRLLQQEGRTLWRRRKRDHRTPGKMMESVGFLTTSASKADWVGALARGIREQIFVCKYRPAVTDFSSFIVTENGTGEAQPGAHDDWVTAVGLGLLIIDSASRMPTPKPVYIRTGRYLDGGSFSPGEPPIGAWS